MNIALLLLLNAINLLQIESPIEVMLKCIEFEEDTGPDLSLLIFLDCKTGCIGEVAREDCLQKKLLTTQGTDDKGHDIISEAVTTDEAREKLLKIVNENPRLKIGFGIKKNEFSDATDIGISEMEKVQNMWGVKLKKTPKNEKGEEFIFVCQQTASFGEMSRKNMLDYEIIHESKDPTSKNMIIEEAYHDFEERAELVEKIRTLLKLGIQVN
jgi:hypothetical protein